MFSHRYSYLFAGLLGGYSFLNIYVLDGDRLYAVELDVLPLLIIILSLTFLVWGINQLVQNRVQKLFKQVHPLVVQLSFSMLAVAGLAFFSAEITGMILQGPFSFSLQNFLLTLAFTSRINLFLNSINGIYFFQKKYKEKELEMERVKSLTSEAKLESINSQLNPHFFFNNLSALSVLIHTDVLRADRYLLKLSEVYRYILKNRGNELVSLQEELNFLEHYLELLSIRFEDALRFKMNIKESCRTKFIPPAVLQLLVENVVKHNYFTPKMPLEISLICDEKYLRISNLKQPKPAIEPTSGIGLQNISQRYQFLNLDIRVIDQPEFFTVELPLIHEEEITFSRR